MLSRRTTSYLLLATLLATTFAIRVPVYASILSEAKECVEESSSPDKQLLFHGQFDSAILSYDQAAFSPAWKALANLLSVRVSRPTGFSEPARGPPSRT